MLSARKALIQELLLYFRCVRYLERAGTPINCRLTAATLAPVLHAPSPVENFRCSIARPAHLWQSTPNILRVLVISYRTHAHPVKCRSAASRPAVMFALCHVTTQSRSRCLTSGRLPLHQRRACPPAAKRLQQNTVSRLYRCLDLPHPECCCPLPMLNSRFASSSFVPSALDSMPEVYSNLPSPD